MSMRRQNAPLLHGRKTTFFVESSDSDIRTLVGMLLQRRQNTNQKVSAKKRQVFWGTVVVKFTSQLAKF